MSKQPEPFIPDLCSMRILAMLMVVLGSLVLLYELSRFTSMAEFLVRYPFSVIYVFWALLISVMGVCYFRRFQSATKAVWLITVSLCWVGLTAFAISLISNLLIQQSNLQVVYPPLSELDLTLRVVISMIMAAGLLRYFWLSEQVRLKQVADMKARLDYLQARLTPHFLFNSLNLVAGYIHTNPNQAEESLLDLSDLLRASLKDTPDHALQDELSLSKKYLELEERRVGDRLTLDWQVEDELSVKLPMLILQPLLENAVTNALLCSAPHVEVSVRHVKGYILLKVSNNCLEKARRSKGHGMGLTLTKQRMATYQPNERNSVEVEDAGHHFSVKIRVKSNENLVG